MIALLLVAAPADGASPPGWLDPGFGSGGVVVVPASITISDISGVAPIARIARTAGGRIYVVSVWPRPSNRVRVEVVAITGAGRLDPAFNNGRPVVVAASLAGFWTVAGPYVTAAGGVETALLTHTATTVVRLTASGRRDRAYSGDGMVALASAPGFAPNSATRLPGGSTRWVEIGQSPSASYLAGLTPGGEVDVRLGPSGRRALPVGGQLAAMGSDPAGRLYIVHVAAGSNQVEILRTTSSGTPDVAWGIQGVATFTLTNAICCVAQFIVPTPTGDVFAVVPTGSADGAYVLNSEIIKIDAHGQLVAGFGTNGMLRLPSPGGNGVITAFDVDPAGRLLVGFGDSGPNRSNLTRLSGLTGATDTAFGQAGIVPTSGATTDIVASSRLLTAGRSHSTGSWRLVVARRFQ